MGFFKSFFRSVGRFFGGGGGGGGGGAVAAASPVETPPPNVQQSVRDVANPSGSNLVFEAPKSTPRGGDALSGATSATDITQAKQVQNTPRAAGPSSSGPQAMGLTKTSPYADSRGGPGAAAAAAAAAANQQTSARNQFSVPAVNNIKFGGY